MPIFENIERFKSKHLNLKVFLFAIDIDEWVIEWRFCTGFFIIQLHQVCVEW